MNIKKITMAIVITTGVVSSAQALSLKAADKSTITHLCMTAVSGNRAAMHNKIKESGLTRKYVANNIQCNGENILVFIDKYGKSPNKIRAMLGHTSSQISTTDISQETVKEK